MSFSYRILPPLRLAHVRFYGTVTGLDLEGAVAAVLGDPAWAPGLGLLWDGRGVAYLSLGPEDVTRAASLPMRFGERRGIGRGAVLVPWGSSEDLARLFEVRTRGYPGQETRVFRDADEAAAWLGLPDDALDDEVRQTHDSPDGVEAPV